MTGCALWFVGLPGSGKSSAARCAHEYLRGHGYKVVHHEMDARRRTYVPAPAYTESERAQAYTLFIGEALHLVEQGSIVLMDASAHRLSIRRQARERISCFAEVLLRCAPEEAMRREKKRPKGRVMADLYEKALLRRKTGQQFEGLGEVIGVDVPFEEDTSAELVIDNTDLNSRETCQKVIAFLDRWLDNA